ncbi:MAG: Cna B-type domain-containing protein [Solobacterium sp.]|nr:Cna B-type domain-containing protein [Solobacterium sp.]
MKYRKIGLLLSGIMLCMNSIRAEDREDPARIRLITVQEDEASPQGCFSVSEYDDQTIAEEELQRITEEGGTASFDHVIGSEDYRVVYTGDPRYEKNFFEGMEGVILCMEENGSDRYAGYGTVILFADLYVSDLLQILCDVRGTAAQELILPEAYRNDADPCIRYMLERLAEKGIHVFSDEDIPEEKTEVIEEELTEEPEEEVIQEELPETEDEVIPQETEVPETEETPEELPEPEVLPVTPQTTVEIPAEEEDTEVPAAGPEETAAAEEGETAPAEEPGIPVLKAPVLRAAAITPVRAVDVPGIEKVDPGAYEDPDYSFSFRTSRNTSVEIWTDPGYDTGKYLRNASGRSLFFLPADDSLSGHMGVVIHDLGVYDGHTVSLRVTFIWEPLTVSGEAVHPYIAVNSNAENKGIGFWLNGVPYTARCEIFDEDTQAPVRCNFGMNFSDVDGYQFYGLRLNSGSTDKIRCLKNSRLYYHKANRTHWFYADTDSYTSDPLDSIRFNVKNCAGFDLTLGDRYCDFYSGFKNPLSSYTAAQSERGVLAKYRNMKALFDRYGTGDVLSGSMSHSWVHFDAEAFGPYAMDTPEKYVIDTDEYAFVNTLDKGEHSYVYRIVYELPIEKEEYYYDLFEIFDELPEGVRPVSFRVITSAGADVTSRFAGEIGGRTVTVRAVDPKSASLYYECYFFDITVELDEHIPASAFTDSGVVLFNTGSVRIDRLNGHEEKPTNPVETHFNNRVDIPVHKVFADARTQYYRPQKVTAVLTADGEDLQRQDLSEDSSWQAVFSDLPVYDADTGDVIGYAVREEDVPGYHASVEKTDAYAFRITNTLYFTEISVEKQLRGNMASYDTDFTFTVTCGRPCTAVYSGDREGVLDLTDGSAQLALKGSEAVTVYGIPAGASIRVQEEDCSAAGYTTRSVNAAFAASEDPENNRVVFINTKEGVLPTGVQTQRNVFMIPPAVLAALLYGKRKKKSVLSER